MTYATVYINLDRSPDRRKRLDAELRKLNIRGRRLTATDGATLQARPPLKANELGCYDSHCRALKMASERSVPTHILEDDAKLSRCLSHVVGTVIKTGLLDRFDIVYLDFFIPHDPVLWGNYRRAMGNVIDLKRMCFYALASYVVTPRAAQKMHQICAEALAQEAPAPIDNVVLNAVNAGQLTACALLPFPTTLHLADSDRSTIGRVSGEVQMMEAALNLLRYSFFAEADLKGYAFPHIEALRTYLLNGEHSEQCAQRIGQALDFVTGARQ